MHIVRRITGVAQLFFSLVAQFFSACWIMRGPLTVAVLGFAMLSLPAQSREIYRGLASEVYAHNWELALAQIILGFVTLGVAGVFVWHCGRALTLLRRQEALPGRDFEGALLRWLPRLGGAAIPLGAALGLYWAVGESQTTANLVQSLHTDHNWPEFASLLKLLEWTPRQLGIASLISLALAGALVLAMVLRTYGKTWKYSQPSPWLLSRGAAIFSGLVALTCVLAFSFAPPALAQTIGTVAVFNIFLVVLVVVLSNLLLIADKTGIPLFSILVAWAVLLSVLDWNDNHVIPIVEHQPSAEAEAEGQPLGPDLIEHFRQWYAGRNDLAYYRDAKEPYPIFIVAAAGGGAYAAHYTATFLARMQDSCPNFAQHVFAISGVSGGSIGATLFASLAKLKASNQDYVGCRLDPQDRYFEERTQKFFEDDFLAPVIASALFPDLVQRVLPAALGRFDRSRALDASLEAAWRHMMEDAAARGDTTAANMESPFEKPFLDLWIPQRKDEAVPVLVLNTTEVANGYRMIISPISTGVLADKQWSKIARVHPDLAPSDKDGVVPDFRLSTAAGISARFPWILPAATVEIGKDGDKIRLVDGGYVESSGVDTANELVKVLKLRTKELQSAGEDIDAKIYLVVLMGYEGTPVRERSLGEASLPLRTLISTWQSRAEIAFFRAFTDACPDILSCIWPDPNDETYNRTLVELPVLPVFLNLRDFKLPLTWQLTEASRAIISMHAGTALRCGRNDSIPVTWPDMDDLRERTLSALGENSCSACTMQYRLAHRYEYPEWDAERMCTKELVPSTTSAIGN